MSRPMGRNMAKLRTARLGILLAGTVLVVLFTILDIRSRPAAGYALRPLVMAGASLGALICLLGIVLYATTPGKSGGEAHPAETEQSLASWARIAKAYTNFALLITNTLLLLLVLNVILGIGFAIADARSAAQQSEALRLYKDFLNEVYPQYTTEQIEMLLNESWFRPPTGNPFTHIKEAPFSGEYVHIDPVGFRWSGDQAPWPPDPDDFTIFVFGGSTTLGLGVADEETIPSVLQDTLRAEGLQASIYNFGTGAFFSSPEMILFQSLLREGYVPDMAIFIDGLNEFYSWDGRPEGMDVCGYEMLHLDQARGYELPMMRLARMLRERVAASQTTGAANADAPAPDDSATNRAVIERWFANRAMTEAIAETYSVEVLYVWQPVPTYHYDLAYHPYANRNPASFGQHQRSGFGYQMMHDVLEEGGDQTRHILDLSEIQADRHERLYVDIVHYSAVFSAEIAGRIGE